MAPPLTPSQIAIVKSTAPALKEHGVEITTLFYKNMLAAHPDLKNIFNETSQTTGRQPRALAAAVFAYATYIDDLGKLSAAVERIAHKHASLDVLPEQYPIVGKYLIEAVARVLGPAVTPDVADAWTAAYAQLADVFIGREAQIYNDEFGDWRGWRRFVIKKKVPESAEITSFYLAPEDGKPLPPFKPGQYISLHMFVEELGYLQPRQYSLSDAPRADYYRISVKKEDGREAGIRGLISNRLHERYDEGDVIELTHPAGEFFVDPKTEGADVSAPLALISAGVGITPMISILNSTVGAGSKRPVAWVHGARSSEVRAFGDHLRGIVEKNPHVDATIFLSELQGKEVQGVDYHHQGRMDLDKLDAARLFLGDAKSQYYVCGPVKFMYDIKNYLASKGVDEDRVHMEVFGTGDE
ncbi:hypothetical protein DL764_001952 [Monosporascus ibericus]|uniref:nitric oxide dioxygenase n=1 Tax=Monosporascus ibericus TaxID=155417 RepID=A0A4Q4TSE2_9PEZI|nr:hypothetical protein DL764_001952 [Monosporascus ibericus]